MSGENAFEYIDFYDFSQSDDEPEFLRSELQDDHALKMDISSTEISELVLPSGAVIGTLLFIFSLSRTPTEPKNQREEFQVRFIFR